MLHTCARLLRSKPGCNAMQAPPTLSRTLAALAALAAVSTPPAAPQQQQSSNVGSPAKQRTTATPWRRVLDLLLTSQPNKGGVSRQADLAAAVAQLAAAPQQPQQPQALPGQQLLPVLAAARHQLSTAPNPVLLRLLTDTTVASLPQLQPQQLAAVLKALCDVQQAAAAVGQQQQHQLPNNNPNSNSKQQLPSALRKAVQAYLRQQQQAMDAGSTAAVAAALAAYKQQRGGGLTVLSMLALDHIPQMTAAQLVQTVGAFAQAQHYNQAVCDAAAQQAMRIVKQQGFKLLTASGDAADAHQQQQQHPSTAALAFSAGELVNLLQALAQLRHYDPSLLDSACACLLRHPHRSLEQLVGLVHTCALLNHFHEQVFEAAVVRAELSMQQATEQQQQGKESGARSSGSSSGSSTSGALPQLLATLSWSCGVMGYWQPDFVRRLSVWSGQVDPQQLSKQELLAWHEVQTSMTDAALLKPHQVSMSPDSLSSSLVVATQAAWATRQQSPRLTAFQKEVVEALQQAGGRCRLNVVLDGPVVVDIALLQRQVGARYRVALQLHPPTDFAANPPHGALGPTAARWRALQARGWRVVTLKQSDWNRLKTKQQQVEYAWRLSQGVEVNAPGMAHVVDQLGAQDAAGKPNSLPQTLMRMLLEGR